MSGKGKPDWKRFEEAVGKFLTALGKGAVVKADASKPDRDTGTPRQRDVWIDAKLFGHFPVSIHVSCKRYKRKLNQQDIDAFVGELASSEANKGVLYSFSGYSENALKKADSRGISCCRLLGRGSPDIPAELTIPSYLFSGQMGLDFKKAKAWTWKLRTWDDLLAVECEPGDQTVLDLIASQFDELEQQAVDELPGDSAVPGETSTTLTVHPAGDAAESLTFNVSVHWRVHRGKMSAHLVEGSYVENTGEFLGRHVFPIVDMKSIDPGPGWEEVDSAEPSSQFVYIIRSGGDTKKAIADAMAGKALPGFALPEEDGSSNAEHGG